MRGCIVVLHLLIITEGSLQELVEGFIGGSAVLPCVSKNNLLKPQDITVRWRYNDMLNVYDIVEGNATVIKQHAAFKNRVETLSKEYEKGDFSLKLKNLRYNDTGHYICYETTVQSVELLVKAEVINNDVKDKNQTEIISKQKDEKNNQGVQSRPEKIATVMSLLSVFTLCV